MNQFLFVEQDGLIRETGSLVSQKTWERRERRRSKRGGTRTTRRLRILNQVGTGCLKFRACFPVLNQILFLHSEPGTQDQIEETQKLLTPSSLSSGTKDLFLQTCIDSPQEIFWVEDLTRQEENHPWQKLTTLIRNIQNPSPPRNEKICFIAALFDIFYIIQFKTSKLI